MTESAALDGGYEVDEDALEAFILRYPGLRARTQAHLRSIVGLTVPQTAMVLDYLITEGWSPPSVGGCGADGRWHNHTNDGIHDDCSGCTDEKGTE